MSKVTDQTNISNNFLTMKFPITTAISGTVDFNAVTGIMCVSGAGLGGGGGGRPTVCTASVCVFVHVQVQTCLDTFAHMHVMQKQA